MSVIHSSILYIQWNLSNPDTNGAEEIIIVSEVSSFQRLKCMQEWYLGWENVSCLERCPQFRAHKNKSGIGWKRCPVFERCPG